MTIASCQKSPQSQQVTYTSIQQYLLKSSYLESKTANARIIYYYLGRLDGLTTIIIEYAEYTYLRHGSAHSNAEDTVMRTD